MKRQTKDEIVEGVLLIAMTVLTIVMGVYFGIILYNVVMPSIKLVIVLFGSIFIMIGSLFEVLGMLGPVLLIFALPFLSMFGGNGKNQ